MADETTRVDAWLHGLLTDNDELLALLPGGVHADVVPSGREWPALVHQHQGSVDVRTATSDGRIMITGLWIVKAIAQTASYLELSPIADAVDDLLEASAGGPAGEDGAVFSVIREAPFRFAEDDSGRQYRHLGGSYRVWCQVP